MQPNCYSCNKPKKFPKKTHNKYTLPVNVFTAFTNSRVPVKAHPQTEQPRSVCQVIGGDKPSIVLVSPSSPSSSSDILQDFTGLSLHLCGDMCTGKGDCIPTKSCHNCLCLGTMKANPRVRECYCISFAVRDSSVVTLF